MPRITLLVILLALLIFLFWPGRVSALFYYPDSVSYGTPANYGLPYEAVRFASKDGTSLSGWFVPARGPAYGTVVHFHGNAQNMSAHFAQVAWLPAEGFNVLVFDYRGYGTSAGKPNRKGVYEDSVAALSYISSRSDIDRSKILVLGQSLGGANAIAAVGGNHFPGIRAVAIEAAFASYRGIVREKLGMVPVISLLKWPLSYLLGDSYSPDRVVDRIAPVPLLLIYGTDDPIISLDQGKLLYAKAREPKEFWTIPTSFHMAAFADPASPYRHRLVQFYLRALSAR